MNNKKTRLVSTLFIILNIACALTVIFINEKMLYDAKKFAENHDATYVIHKDEIFDITPDRMGNLFTRGTQGFSFIGNNGPVLYEKGEREAFHKDVRNAIESWMTIASVGFVLSLFGIYYNCIHRMTCYGYVFGAIMCLLSVLGLGILDGLHIFIGITFAIIAILIFREREQKIRKVKPVIPLNELD